MIFIIHVEQLPEILQNLWNKIANLWHCVDLTNSIIIIAIVTVIVFFV